MVRTEMGGANQGGWCSTGGDGCDGTPMETVCSDVGNGSARGILGCANHNVLYNDGSSNSRTYDAVAADQYYEYEIEKIVWKMRARAAQNWPSNDIVLPKDNNWSVTNTGTAKDGFHMQGEFANRKIVR